MNSKPNLYTPQKVRDACIAFQQDVHIPSDDEFNLDTPAVNSTLVQTILDQNDTGIKGLKHTINEDFNDEELLMSKNINREVITNHDGSVTIFPPGHYACQPFLWHQLFQTQALAKNIADYPELPDHVQDLAMIEIYRKVAQLKKLGLGSNEYLKNLASHFADFLKTDAVLAKMKTPQGEFNLPRIREECHMEDYKCLQVFIQFAGVKSHQINYLRSTMYRVYKLNPFERQKLKANNNCDMI